MTICKEHNAHLRLFPDGKNVFLWVGVFRGEDSIWRCNIDSEWLQKTNLDLKSSQTIHVTGLPENVTTIQEISDAITKRTPIITFKGEETYLDFSQKSEG